MKSIGGYFELELSNGVEYHTNVIKLSDGRSALEYILKVRNYKKIYIPYFTCNVILEPILKTNVNFEYYEIDENLEPKFDFSSIKENECFLYTNYYGFKEDFILKLSLKCKNLIIDNAQAFFSKPIENIDTFYSPRKFFGVPDGGYLYTNSYKKTEIQESFSHHKFKHLLKRIDLSAEDGYADFIANEDNFKNNILSDMSFLTNKILKSIDYKTISEKRRNNFKFLSKHLDKSNQFNLKYLDNHVPMTYPYWSENKMLKEILQNNKIYIAQYWSEVLDLVPIDSIEYNLTTKLLHLPIDQRYDESDLIRIVNIING